MKKFITLIIAAVMCFSAAAFLVGCNKKTPYDEANFNETGDQIVKEKVTIKMFAPKHDLHIADFNNMTLFKELEAKTNIHIEWVYGPVSTYETNRSNAWSSKSRPDAFFLWNTLEEQIKYAANKTLAPLDELIDKYAPNYKALLDSSPDMKKAAELEDGKMYSTVLISDVPRDRTFKQYINKDLLDYLSIPMPETTDDFYNALKAIKEFDNSIIPLSSYGLNQTRNFLMSAFGFVATGIELSGDTVVYVPETNNYREYLKYAAKLFKEGLLDNQTFDMKDMKALAAKGSKVACFDSAAAYLIVGESNDAKYEALSPLTSPVNQTKMWLDFNNMYSPTGLVITEATPYKREIIRWIDNFYAEWTRELQAFGSEGENWDWDDAEKTSFTFNVPSGKSPEEYRGSITPGAGLGAVGYWDKDFVLKENNALTQRINKCVEDAQLMDYLKVPYPTVKMTQTENTEIAIIRTDLNMYIADFEHSIISGQKDLTDAVWTKHLSDLTTIKTATFKKVHQDAYNRYKV